MESETATWNYAGLEFEWRRKKAASNLVKHGVPFEEVATTFKDRFGCELDDPDSTGMELRIVLVALSGCGRLLATVYTERGKKIRLISARYAERSEESLYDRGRRIGF